MRKSTNDKHFTQKKLMTNPQMPLFQIKGIPISPLMSPRKISSNHMYADSDKFSICGKKEIKEIKLKAARHLRYQSTAASNQDEISDFEKNNPLTARVNVQTNTNPLNDKFSNDLRSLQRQISQLSINIDCLTPANNEKNSNFNKTKPFINLENLNSKDSSRISGNASKKLINEIRDNQNQDDEIINELAKNEIIKPDSSKLTNRIISIKQKNTVVHINNLTSPRTFSRISSRTPSCLLSSPSRTNFIHVELFSRRNSGFRPCTSLGIKSPLSSCNGDEKSQKNPLCLKEYSPFSPKTEQNGHKETRMSIKFQSENDHDVSPKKAANTKMIIEDIPFEEKLQRINRMYNQLDNKYKIPTDEVEMEESIDVDFVKGTLDTNKPIRKKVFEFPQQDFKDLQNNIQKLNTKFELAIKNDNLFDNEANKYDFLKVNSQKLTKIELDTIREEYKRKEEVNLDVHWEKIDYIVSKNKFFAKYMKHIRMALLRYGKFVEYPQGYIIFREGDFGDLMYVILAGSVNVKAKQINPEGIEEDMLISCLYEGEAFGELSMLGTNRKNKKLIKTYQISIDQLGQKKTYQEIKKELYNKKWLANPNNAEVTPREQDVINSSRHNDKTTITSSPKNVTKDANEYSSANFRAATIEVSQNAALISIPRESFRTILLSLIQKELDEKVKVLMCLPFFEKQEPLTLLPLANNLNLRKYKMGEIIVHEGEVPKFFGIIAMGRCSVALEFLLQRSIENIPFIKGQMADLRNFSFATGYYSAYNVQQPNHENKTKFIDMKVYKKNPFVAKTRTFPYDTISINNKNNIITYKQHAIVNSLIRGDYFGIRAILDDNTNELENSQKYKTKLNIIAATSVVEIYTIETNQLQYVPEFLRAALREGLKNQTDFDDYNIQQIKKEFDSWNVNKQHEAYKLLIETHTQRLKDQMRSEFKKF